VAINGIAEPAAIEAILADIKQSSGVAPVFAAGNLRHPAEIEKMIESAKVGLGGRIDILINNAGIQHVCPLVDFPPEKWDDIIAINLSSVFHSTRLVLREMLDKQWGRIINISSVHGLVGSLHKSAYVASKHGVVGFTKVVALETAGSGVTVNCVNPGWVHTPLVEKQIVDKAKETGQTREQALRHLLEEKQPSKQFVEVEQLADVVLFFCSEASAQITGVSLPVDGGWTAQ